MNARRPASRGPDRIGPRQWEAAAPQDPSLSTRRGLSAKARGFTLIEVLVALTIMAVALTAAMRAMGSMTESSLSLQQRMLAEFSAENYLAELRLARRWPEPGVRGSNCAQGGTPLYCEETVSGTPNPAFRRVEVAVYASAADRSVRLAWLVTIVPNETRNLL